MTARVEIISTGGELMSGRFVDTNFAAMARMLAPLAVEVRYHSTYGDSFDDLCEGLKTALARADVAVMTGGLGPTADDLTRAVAAEVFHRPLEFRAAWWTRIRSRLRRARPIQRRQAFFPRGAAAIDNPLGTAPGFRIGGFFALSGVPAEMADMMARGVLPVLRRRFGRRARAESVVRLFGPSESAVETVIGDAPHGITAFRGGIRVTGPRALVARVRRAFAGAVYAVGDADLEEVVFRALKRRRATLAVAESFTGGRVADRLTGVPGVSAVLREACVCYSDASKVRRLGVREETLRRHGAVSAATAREMAEGAARTGDATASIATTGIAGPAGGTRAKPVGLGFLAVHARGRTTVREVRLFGSRGDIKERAADAALDLLRRALA